MYRVGEQADRWGSRSGHYRVALVVEGAAGEREETDCGVRDIHKGSGTRHQHYYCILAQYRITGCCIKDSPGQARN